MGMNFQAPKGVSEYIPPRSAIFELVRNQLCAPAKSAGYQYMELPVFEDTALFARGVGKLGRKTTISIGLVILIIMLVLLYITR